jgi:hypothetical protein
MYLTEIYAILWIKYIALIHKTQVQPRMDLIALHIIDFHAFKTLEKIAI